MPCPVWCAYVGPCSASRSRTCRSTSSCDDAGPAERDALVQRAADGVEAAPCLAVRRADEDGVRGVRPGAVDPRRRVGEDEIARPDDALGRDAAAGRGRLRAGRDGQDGRHAPAGFAMHRRGGEPRELGLADARPAWSLTACCTTSASRQARRIARDRAAPQLERGRDCGVAGDRCRPASRSHSAIACGRLITSTPVGPGAIPAAANAAISAA